MASGMRLLLRLPPCVRQQLFSQQSWTTTGLSLKNIQSRTFGFTSRNLAKSPSPTPKPFKRPGMPTQPRPVAPTTTSNRPAAFLMDTVAPNLDRVLLYTAPNHAAFFRASYLVAVLGIFGGYNIAQTFMKDAPNKPKLNWWVKIIEGIPALMLIAMGTAAALAPQKVIKSISIVRPKVDAPRILRFEIRRNLHFLKPDVLETSPRKVFLDKKIFATEDLQSFNIPLTSAKTFTEEYFNSNSTNPSKKRTFTQAIGDKGRGIMNFWPTAKRETRRILMRDQMAYVKIEGNGNFKLDLQGCTVLDRWRPLMKVMNLEDPSYQTRNLWGKVKSLLKD